MQACLDAEPPQATAPKARTRSRRRASSAATPRSRETVPHGTIPTPTPELSEPIVDPLTLFGDAEVPATLQSIIAAEMAKQQITPEQREEMEAVLRGDKMPRNGSYSPEDSETKPWLSS
jgi:hypothetical protein